MNASLEDKILQTNQFLHIEVDTICEIEFVRPICLFEVHTAKNVEIRDSASPSKRFAVLKVQSEYWV